MVGVNIFNVMIRPCLLLNKNESARDVPWFGNIDTETVMVTFNHLTAEKRLPSKLQTYLRAVSYTHLTLPTTSRV